MAALNGRHQDISPFTSDDHGLGTVYETTSGPKRTVTVGGHVFGGSPDASAGRSYRADADGMLHVVSASVPAHQTVVSWAVIAENVRFRSPSNTGSVSMSGCEVDGEGALRLLEAA